MGTIDKRILNIMDNNSYIKKVHYILKNNNKKLQFIIKKCFKFRHIFPILILKVDEKDFDKIDNIYFKKSGYYYFFIDKLLHNQYIYSGKIMYIKFKMPLIQYSYP